MDTQDGYTLKIHRILPKVKSAIPRLGPVFIMHGLFMNAADYLLTGASIGLRKFINKWFTNFLLILNSVLSFGQRLRCVAGQLQRKRSRLEAQNFCPWLQRVLDIQLARDWVLRSSSNDRLHAGCNEVSKNLLRWTLSRLHFVCCPNVDSTGIQSENHSGSLDGTGSVHVESPHGTHESFRPRRSSEICDKCEKNLRLSWIKFP